MGRADRLSRAGRPAAARRTTIVLALATACSGEPPPDPARGEEPCTRARAEPAERCGACHPAIYEQWREGPHAAAHDDPLFRAEYEPAPSRFCTDCHAAGQARFGHDPHHGVDCSSCHVPEDPPPRDGVSMCAGCHQFDFPAAALGRHGTYDPADPLQDTVHEWRRSAATRTCVGCHMPAAADPRAPHPHRLLDTHDPALLARALRVGGQARREPRGLVVELTLAPGRVGHRVPTGDMFRRLRVTLEVEGQPPRTRWLGRMFAQAPASDDQGFRLRPVLDDRVPAPGEEPPLELREVFEPGDAERVRWSVDLYRMPPAQARDRGLDPELVRSAMASGELVVETAD